MTASERLLWGTLRAGRLVGEKFRRQVVLGPYVLDFYHHAARLAIEIDGDSHADRGDYDRDRQNWLQAQGLRVLRFSNDDVLKDLDVVLEAILLAVRVPASEDRPSPGSSEVRRPSPGPAGRPLPGGEGLP